MKKLIPLALLLVLSLPLFSQSSLEKAKRDIKKEKKSDESSDSYSDSDDDPSEGERFVGQVLYWVGVGVLIGIYEIEDHLHYRLSSYPYYMGDATGDYTPYLEIEDKNNFRLDLSNAYMIGSNLNGNHLKLKIRPTHLLYLQTDYTELFERSADGEGYNHLSLFNFNLGYDRIRLRNLSLGFTLGATYIGNDVQKVGFNYGLSTELYTPFNLSFSGSIKGSYVNDTPVDQMEFAARYHHKRFFASIGMEFIRIGSPVFRFTTFGIGVYL